MSLSKYNEKRKFDKTPEPKGGKAAKDQLIFVIQKHDASRLHYDFRLEVDGVLKSWAVPKGPSTDPSVKRLAMMVEDHPYDYKDFEGTIPEGNYGAGTVMVWDFGTYEPLEEVDGKLKEVKGKKAQEKLLQKELRAGSVKVRLNGKKVKGEYALVKTSGMAENAWLLIKHRDKFASEDDITEKDRSAVSRRTLAGIEKDGDAVWESNHEEKKPSKSSGTKAAAKPKASETEAKDPAEDAAAEKKSPDVNVPAILKKAKKQKFPDDLQPMLATLVDGPFDDPGWEYEVKWDGYRALAYLNKGEVSLQSRNRKSFNDKFYPIYQQLTDWKINAVIDGEIVVINDKGLSDFNALQNWRSEADGELVYYAFDILWFEGKSLIHLPLTERKAILQSIVDEKSPVQLGYSVEADGHAFFEAAQKMGLEGIIAKKSDSEYYPGLRTRDWLKVKINKRQEVIIAGYTLNEGSSKLFSALLLAAYENGELRYAGKVGTGFKEKQQKEMLALFKPLITKNSPFKETPDYNKPSRFRPNPPHANATWLKPKLVCEISFTEITADGVFRHPSFEGMREDKSAKDVVRELEKPAEEVVDEANDDSQTIIKKPGKAKRKTLLNPKEETQVRKINGHEVKFSNLGKLYWPDDKIQKRELINYYYQVAPFILPYLENRPLSLNRFPNGIKGKSFYQKDVTGKVPGWIETTPYTSEGELKNFMLCNDEAALLYMANLGAIDVNPWNSRIETPDNPDWCLLDLDPDTTNTFEQVIETARAIKSLLDSLAVPAYCKTSGSTGLHIYIPLGAKYSYDQCQLFAEWVAGQVQHQLPDFTSVERMTKNRKGKLYIDYLQNRPKATLAAPYSVRPKPGATVSMPLHWDEVRKGLQLKDFTIYNAIERIQREGDLFKPVLGKGIDLEEVIAKMEIPAG
ncbi:ATP-dependent DNA ligase [Dyadobacter beijingensis]|uniref:DNA ligase (ATP) n=1 Tax=Dyadobacter beijingensis TaxID=365489 RepID=A0ABQ2HSB4_9BACT|nr:DNA ligase D [Dyadobacter beijingensis]GGM88594.1 ATP-dependent DNA ligase [Dyadobacter beijingensis]